MTKPFLQLADAAARHWESAAAEHDRAGLFPAADMALLRDSGLLGLMVPERLGGMGAGFEDYVCVAMRLAQGSGSSAPLFNMHASVTGALAGVPTSGSHAGVATRSSMLGCGAPARGRWRDVRRRDQRARCGSRLSRCRPPTSAKATGSGSAATSRRAPERATSTHTSSRHEMALVARRRTPISYFLVAGDAIGPVDETWIRSACEPRRATASHWTSPSTRVR